MIHLTQVSLRHSIPEAQYLDKVRTGQDTTTGPWEHTLQVQELFRYAKFSSLRIRTFRLPICPSTGLAERPIHFLFH